MADAIELYLDISTPQGALVKGLSDKNTFSLGPFYQGSQLNLRIFPVVPTGNVTSGPYYSKVSLAGMAMEVVVGPRAGADDIKAAQYSWTAQTTNDAEGKSGYFYATLNLNTSELNTAVGTSDSYSTYIEIRLSRAGGSMSPVYQQQISITSTVKDPSGESEAPTPAVSYMTRDECFANFVAWNNALHAVNAGRNIILVSPDGSNTREIGVEDGGAALDNIT